MKTVTLWCEAGKHDWERPSQRGRRPVNCPEHSVVVLSAPPALDPDERNERKLEALSKARETRAANRLKQKQEEDKKRIEHIQALVKTLPNLSDEYDQALAKASKAKTKDEVNTLFDRADALQNRILGILRAEKALTA